MRNLMTVLSPYLTSHPELLEKLESKPENKMKYEESEYFEHDISIARNNVKVESKFSTSPAL